MFSAWIGSTVIGCPLHIRQISQVQILTRSGKYCLSEKSYTASTGYWALVNDTVWRKGQPWAEKQS